MSSVEKQKPHPVDPDLLQLLGQLLQLLGVAEHADRLLRNKRRSIRARHSVIDRNWNSLQGGLVAGRGALRALGTTLPAELSTAPPETIALSLPPGDFEVFRESLSRLHRVISAMTSAAYALEGATEPVATEVERFHKISVSGRQLQKRIQAALAGQVGTIPALLSEADSYFERCERSIRDRDRWLAK